MVVTKRRNFLVGVGGTMVLAPLVGFSRMNRVQTPPMGWNSWNRNA